MSPEVIEEDYVTLQQALDNLTQDKMLKAALSVYCLCYGTKPNEVSFANHARVSYGFYDTIARVEGGGEAFIRAFRSAFKEYPIDVCCNASISECLDIQNSRVGRFLLSSGKEVIADECIFTIHPSEILKILPRQHFSKAFWERVASFESSNGFFSVFGAIDGEKPGLDFEPSILSLLPHADINLLLDVEYNGPQVLAIFQSRECIKDESFHVLNAFEPSFVKQVAPGRIQKLVSDHRGMRHINNSTLIVFVSGFARLFPSIKIRSECMMRQAC